MYKFLLLLLSAGVVFTAGAQSVHKTQPFYTQKHKLPPSAPTTAPNKVVQNANNYKVVKEQSVQSMTPSAPTKHQPTFEARSGAGTEIGTTYYDLQSNYGVCRRILNDNGTLYATWTMSNEQGSPFNDRGTGFNQSTDGGNTWAAAPEARLENVRTGWPEIAKTSGGRLVSTSHATSDPTGIAFTWLDSGSQEWQTKIIDGDADATWARMAVSGNTIHVIASRLNGQFAGIDGGLAYFKSTDEGDTWTGPTELPNESAHYPSINADSYAIDAVGNTVVIVIGGYGREVLLYRSEDAGANWTQKVIVAVPNPLIDTGAATAEEFLDPQVCAGGQMSLVLDANKKVHLMFDRVWNFRDACGATDGVFYTPNSTCLMYWNEDMLMAKEIGKTVRHDYNADGIVQINSTDYSIQGYGTSLVGQPSLGLDANGNIYCSYSSLRDGAEQAANADAGITTKRLYRDVYLIKSTDNGATWIGPYNVSNNTNLEDVYASIAKKVDDNVHIIWQQDNLAGVYLRFIGTTQDPANGQSVATVNSIQYAKIPVGDITNPNWTGDKPQIFIGAIPYALEKCTPNVDRFQLHALDYPDGDVTSSVSVGGVDITTPNADPTTGDLTGTPYYWNIEATDSENNTASSDLSEITTDGIAPEIKCFPDATPPTVFPQPVFFFDVCESGVANTYYTTSFDLYDTIYVVKDEPYVDLGAVALDNGDGFGCPADLEVQNPLEGGTGQLGTFQVVYSAADINGNQAEDVIRTVIVIGADLDAPQINVFNLDTTAQLANGDTVFLPITPGGVWGGLPVQAIDNVDGIVNPSNISTSGNVNLEVGGVYAYTITATDEHGNSSSITVYIAVQDSTAPTITLQGGANISVAPGQCGTGCFTIPGFSATDNVDGNLSSQVTVTIKLGAQVVNCVCTGQQGSYIVTYTVSDAAGNVATKTRIVTVPASCGNNGCSVGVEPQINATSINVYPSPVNNTIFIKANNFANQKAIISLYNVVGELVSHSEAILNNNTTYINVSDKSAGVYTVTVATEKGTFNQKIVIAK